ncbi:MAG: VOC family protein [Actinomycetota bacterium]
MLLERDPVIMKVANTWLILNEGGGPTDDKPNVSLVTPTDPDRTSAFLNVRVADINQIYEGWTAKGAQFLTEPKDHGREIRAYVRDRTAISSRADRRPDSSADRCGLLLGYLQIRQRFGGRCRCAGPRHDRMLGQ